jgi:hypothetical protein
VFFNYGPIAHLKNLGRHGRHCLVMCYNNHRCTLMNRLITKATSTSPPASYGSWFH